MIEALCTRTGLRLIVSKEFYDYYTSNPVPVVGMRRDFLRRLMRFARYSKNMPDKDYYKMEEEVLDDVLNIYHANRNRNKRRRKSS